MNNYFTIRGFKCFLGNTFQLGPLTVLTGSNGSGKSSLIQALLLLRLAIEKNLIRDNNFRYSDSEWKNVQVPLNLGYELALGRYNSIFNEAVSEIEFKLDEESFGIPFPEEGADGMSVLLLLLQPDNYQLDFPFWRMGEFYYLNTERLGPRLSLASNYTDFLHCGFKGEFTAQVLLNSSFFQVDEKRLFEGSKSPYLPQQVDYWLEYVSPGTIVRAEALGDFNAQIRIQNSSTKQPILATNIGFGISYCLPIIVTGLIAKVGAMFIIENPEAHLHPKAQSNLGFFLGVIAAAGVKLVIETHSEHIVNGIRRSSLVSPSLSVDNINIYHFYPPIGTDQEIRPIKILANGDLSDFPTDFFDQTRQDLLEIIKLSNR